MGATEIGPVDYLVVAFPGNQFKGEIAPAIADLVDAGTVRIIDIAFVGKDANGESVAFELTELDPEVRKGLDNLGIEVEGLMNEDDLKDAAEALEPISGTAGLGERVGSGRRPGDSQCRWTDGRLRATAARGRHGRTRVGTRRRRKGELR